MQVLCNVRNVFSWANILIMVANPGKIISSCYMLLNETKKVSINDTFFVSEFLQYFKQKNFKSKLCAKPFFTVNYGKQMRHAHKYQGLVLFRLQDERATSRDKVVC